MSISIVKHFQWYFFSPKMGLKFAVLGIIEVNMKDKC